MLHFLGKLGMFRWERRKITKVPCRIYDSAVINTANFSLSDLTVVAVSPFGDETESSSYNYSRIDYNPYDTFSPAFYFILLPVFIIYWVAKKSVRRIL